LDHGFIPSSPQPITEPASTDTRAFTAGGKTLSQWA
jgi:hypothetical protein